MLILKVSAYILGIEIFTTLLLSFGMVDNNEAIRVAYWELDYAKVLCNKRKGIDFMDIKLNNNFVTCKDGVTLSMNLNVQKGDL